VAYHFLNAGSVLGNFHTASVTVGLLGRAEFGYTRAFHQQGGTAGLSPLWDGGFNIVHGKLNVVKENAGESAWLPAFSAGFAARTQVHHVSGQLASKSYNNADFYLVASKTVTQTKVVPIVLNLGYKATNAQVYGLAGNAPAYRGRLFGAAAFVFKGPRRASHFRSSSHRSARSVNLQGPEVPPTITFAARIVPSAKRKSTTNSEWRRPPLIRRASTGGPHQFALGISYGL